MDGRRGDAEGGGEGFEVVWVSGEDVVAELQSQEHEVSVDDVSGVGEAEELADSGTVIEGMHGQRLDEGREAGLAGAATPDLTEDGMGGVQGRAGPLGSGEERSGGLFAAIDRDQDVGVEDHSP